MLHRLAIILITGFWVVMTSLLVVRELYPEATRLNSVPPGYVGQLVFQHEQASDLRILSEGGETGYIHLQPRSIEDTGKRTLDMHGSVGFTPPGGHKQQLTFVATLDLARDLAAEHLHLDLSTSDPGRHLNVALDFVGKKASIGTMSGKKLTDEAAFTLDEAGFNSLLTGAGVDSALIRQAKAAQEAMPKFDFSAQSSSTKLAGEKLSTFLLIIRAAEQTVVAAHISQLGQVLSAEVPALGWKFVPIHLPK